MFYLPTILLFMLAFFVLLVLLFTLIMVGTISYAFDKVGLDPGAVFGLLLACLAGSYVNIPLHRIRNEQVVTDQVAPFFGFRCAHGHTARNSSDGECRRRHHSVPGGHLSVGQNRLSPASGDRHQHCRGDFKALGAPGAGTGHRHAGLHPPILSALTALLLAPAQAPMVAYISGTFGVLIGADLLNLRNLTALRTPVVSIGGAGTFDGIFLTGIIAVLLA